MDEMDNPFKSTSFVDLNGETPVYMDLNGEPFSVIKNFSLNQIHLT